MTQQSRHAHSGYTSHVSRHIPTLRYFLVVLLPIVLTVLALLCSSVFAGEHPFGEPGTEKREKVQAEVNDLLRRSHTYAFTWAQANPDTLHLYDRAPVAVVFCRSQKELAERTKRPSSEHGGVVLARTDIEKRLIYLSRPSTHDLYHEAYHLWFRRYNEEHAERFARWCLERDEALERLRTGKKIEGLKK